MKWRRLRRLFWRARRIAGITPFQRVFRELERRGVALARCRALDVFAGDGSLHTVDWAPRVGSVELWERNSTCRAPLQHRFPEAEIRIVDSFTEVHRRDATFDLIVVDDGKPPGSWAGEHFALFPHLFRLLASPGVLVVNVVPRMRVVMPENLALRGVFYGTDHPEQISLAEMARTYETRAAASDLRMVWWLAVGWGVGRRVIPRRNRVFSLAMRFER